MEESLGDISTQPLLWPSLGEANNNPVLFLLAKIFPLSVGKFPWRKVPHYLAGQYLGAFLGSATVFCVYWDALVWYEHDRGSWRSTPDTAGIFSTYPGPHLTLAGGILDQVVVTALLLTCVCAITDRRNMKVSSHMRLEVWL